MLTIETLKANTNLAGLTDAQLSAIAEMSANDENNVLATKIGELHGRYDADILAVTGQSKNQGEKSYDFLKRILTEYKQKGDANATTAAQLATAKKTIEDLKAKIEAGSGDESLKQQLKDAKTRASQLQEQLTANVADFDKQKKELEGRIKDVHLDYAFKAAASGLKFKAGITDGIAAILINSAKAEVLQKGTPDFVDDAAGNKRIIFRDAAGNVLNNPANNLNPYTVEELLMQTSLKDVIDTGKQQPGGGTKPPTGKGGSGVFSLDGAKTQVEADRMIEEKLLADGLTRDSQEFADQLLAIRTENKVSELPLR